MDVDGRRHVNNITIHWQSVPAHVCRHQHAAQSRRHRSPSQAAGSGRGIGTGSFQRAAFVAVQGDTGMRGERGLKVKATSQGCSLFVSSDRD